MLRPSIHAIPALEKSLTELEQLAAKAAVHRKKFEYSVNQFRRFVQAYSVAASSEPFSEEQSGAYHTIITTILALRNIMSEYTLQTWAAPTIEYPCNHVASALTGMAGKLRNAAISLDAQAGHFFDPDAPQWLQYHLLDLKGVSASFHQYIKAAKRGDRLIDSMTERLGSVDAFIEKYGKETVAPGIRVFSPIPVHYQSWRANHDDFQEIREIGSGVSANVFYGIDKRSNKEVAIKKLKFTKLTGSELQSFQREVAVLASAQHPALLGFVGATDSPPFYIVTEWMGGGTLYHELHKHKRLNPTKLSIAAFDIARGMQFLHSCHIIHRDLKSLNVLFDTNGRAKICDFGFSKTERDDAYVTPYIGTPHWMAPELLSPDATYTSKVDVYAYGIVLWEIATGEIPYPNLEAPQIYVQVYVNDLRPPIPDTVDPQIKALIIQCWDRNPDLRPSFDEIVSHFIRERIVLAGTNAAEFDKYLEENVGCSSSGVREIENLLETADFTQDRVFESFVGALEKVEIPPNLSYKCWEVVEGRSGIGSELLARAAVSFLRTPVKVKAAGVLRSLPPGLIPPPVISQAIAGVPTGSEEFDRDMLITACKNGMADLAVLYALLPSHVKLSLEIVAQHGVDVTLKAAVADRCAQALTSKDTALVCVAIRCLVGIGEVRRIRGHLLKQFVSSTEGCLRNCALVAASHLALQAVELDQEVLDEVLSGPDDSVAQTFIVSACAAPHVALYVVNKLLDNCRYSPTLVLRVLLMAGRHEEVWPAIMIALQRLDLSSLREQWGTQIDELQTLVSVK
jgi:serine/threonine protein kinase